MTVDAKFHCDTEFDGAPVNQKAAEYAAGMHVVADAIAAGILPLLSHIGGIGWTTPTRARFIELSRTLIDLGVTDLSERSYGGPYGGNYEISGALHGLGVKVIGLNDLVRIPRSTAAIIPTWETPLAEILAPAEGGDA